MIVVDRIEGPIAVLEMGGEFVEVPCSVLPEGTAEGDLLEFSAKSGDGLETDAKRQAVERVERLRASDPGDMEIDL